MRVRGGGSRPIGARGCSHLSPEKRRSQGRPTRRIREMADAVEALAREGSREDRAVPRSPAVAELCCCRCHTVVSEPRISSTQPAVPLALRREPAWRLDARVRDDRDASCSGRGAGLLEAARSQAKAERLPGQPSRSRDADRGVASESLCAAWSHRATRMTTRELDGQRRGGSAAARDARRPAARPRLVKRRPGLGVRPRRASRARRRPGSSPSRPCAPSADPAPRSARRRASSISDPVHVKCWPRADARVRWERCLEDVRARGQ